MPNRLSGEQSPYLLQHQHNPVDWYPWGAEAFGRARQEDKPIFLSIGYATCHWCHVMERESFEDEEVARLMNEVFVSIKVDREERPDIDGIYMNVCQMMTGQGGWPLTIVMTPEGKPFYAATYLPRDSRHGRIGMADLVPRIGQVWEERRDEVLGSADEITQTLQRAAAHTAPGRGLDPDWLRLAYHGLVQRYDARHGGFGSAPKFPTPHNLLLLLRYWKRTGEGQALDMVVQTLRAMRRGGIYDQLGFGFHRYSTDAAWRLPHFEKMLYDQALLAMAYVEAYQATGQPGFRRTAEEIFTYVQRDMTAPEGAFFSAEDADSEGQEGKFYVWTVDEVREVLGPEEADLVVAAFQLDPQGNFEEEATRRKTGENVLFSRKDPEALAAERGISAEVLHRRLAAARERLFAHREGRVRPAKDDKVLTDWNGLMVAALAKASQAFGDTAYAETAARAADFLLETMRTEEGRLLHRYRGGEAGIQANLDDYAFLIWGLVELYEATFDVGRLEAALALQEQQLRHFWDEEGGGFFFTPDDGEDLIVRQKELYDGAVPSGNSVALLNLLRLGRITGEPVFEARADALVGFAAAQVGHAPSAFTALLMGVDFLLGPSREIVVVGRAEAEDTRALLDAVRMPFLPKKVLLFRPAGEEHPAIARLAPFVQAQRSLEGRATAYICRDYTCQAPTTDVAAVLEELEGTADTARG